MNALQVTLVVAAFLAGVSRYYHPPFGLTAFIDFSPSNHAYEIPAVQSAPHFDNPGSTGYDGVYYAQLAVDPLLRDPAIDHALDDPPYRARRILFSWTAYALGLGRPAWILQVYAVQNVIVWLLFAWLLCRWMRRRNKFRLFYMMWRENSRATRICRSRAPPPKGPASRLRGSTHSIRSFWARSAVPASVPSLPSSASPKPALSSRTRSPASFSNSAAPLKPFELSKSFLVDSLERNHVAVRIYWARS